MLGGHRGRNFGALVVLFREPETTVKVIYRITYPTGKNYG